MNQFAWLTKQLSMARLFHQKVWILGHIVPGASATFEATWHKRYVRSFVNILGNYTDVIQMNFFSHLHRDSFRLVFDENSGKIPKSPNRSHFRTCKQHYAYFFFHSKRGQ
jgi:sphingomyelin phosphodiesterase acid-like 3